jgi:hypothetical protein
MAAPRTLNPGGDLAPPIKPGPDVYLGLLVISLIAQLAAVLFLWMDRSQYPDKSPPKVPAPQSVGASTPPAQPAAPAGGALGAPGGGALGGQPGGGAIGGAPQAAPPGGAAPPAAPPGGAAPPGAAPGGAQPAPAPQAPQTQPKN